MTRTLAVSSVRAWLLQIFRALKAPEPTAEAVTHSLWEAELAGHESHGLIRVPEYAQAVFTEAIDPAAQPVVLAENATQVHLDCRRAFGAYAAGILSDRLRNKGLAQGMASGALRGAGHLGRAGDYTSVLAEAGLVGVAFVNGGGSVPRVAPHGGVQPFLGTNPISVAVPGPAGEAPIVVDFSTATVASGKIRVLHDSDSAMPDGWVLDSQGQPTTRTQDYYAGGMLTTAAAHKGYGLSLAADVLAGLVSGSGCPGVPEGYLGGNGFFLMACDLKLFLPQPELQVRVTEWARALRAVPPADPRQPVRLAGELEQCNRERSCREGVVISEKLWQRLRELAIRLQVEPL